MKAKRTLAAFLFVGATVLSVVACNVFTSLEQCTSDADCPSGGTCDPSGRFCLVPVAPETGTDADATPPIDAGDAADTAPPLKCYPEDPFPPAGIKPVAGLENLPVISARLTPGETSIIYSALRTGCIDEPCFDFYVATRSTRMDPFVVGANPQQLTSVNCSTASEYWPTLSEDGTLMFFESSRADTDGGACGNDRARIWTAYRPSGTLPDFQQPFISSAFADITPEVYDSAPYLHPNGRSLYFASTGRPRAIGNIDIWLAVIDPKTHLVTSVDPIPGINTADSEHFPVISTDDKALYFSKGDFGTTTNRDIYVATRSAPGATFGTPKPLLPEVSDDLAAWVSEDQCRLYFTTDQKGKGMPIPDAGSIESGYRLWVAERAPR